MKIRKNSFLAKSQRAFLSSYERHLNVAYKFKTFGVFKVTVPLGSGFNV